VVLRKGRRALAGNGRRFAREGSVPDVAVTEAELELLSVESLPRFSFCESGEEQGGGIIDASGSCTVLIRASADLGYDNRSGSKLFE
jgi:hypothetical protein